LRCEKFLNRLNQNELISNKDKNKEISDNSASISDFDNNFTINEQPKKYLNKSNNQIGAKKNILKKKMNINLIIYFILFLLIVYIYLLIPLITLNKYISLFEMMGLYMYRMLNFHNNLIKIYNSFNEYLFIEVSTVENIPVLDFIEKACNNLYDTFSAEINYQLDNADKIPGVKEILLKVQKEKLCNLNDYCEYYIDIATSLGYLNFVYFFVGEINTKINYIKILSEKFSKQLWDNDIKKRMIILFNSLHYDIDYMFNYGALYYIESELTLTSEKFFEKINSKYQNYIIVYTIFMICIILLYFFYWTPFIKDIQDQIYKAKLALNIIPIEILESQTNIKSLLGISDIND
jgi:hypothetical protein